MAISIFLNGLETDDAARLGRVMQRYGFILPESVVEQLDSTGD